MLRLMVLARTLRVHPKRELFPLFSFHKKSYHSDALESVNAKIYKSTFTDVEIPNCSFTDYLFRNINGYEDRTAVMCGSTGRSYSTGLLRMLSRNFGKALIAACGCQPREVIGVLLPNLPETLMVYYGAFDAGLVVSAANPLHTPDELKRQFFKTGVKVIVTVSQLFDVALTIAAQLPEYRATISLNSECDASRKILGFKKLLMRSYSVDLPRVCPSDLALLPFSSGTSGMPKAVMLSHRNLITNIQQMSHKKFFYPSAIFKDCESIATFTILPIFHIFGFSVISTLVFTKSLAITIPRFTMDEYVKVLENRKPNFLFVVPALLSMLLGSQDVTRQHFKSIVGMYSGADILSRSMIENVLDKFGNDVSVFQGYGMTECSPGILSTTNEKRPDKYGSTGLLLSNTEAKLLPTHVSVPSEFKDCGELCIRGPQVMQGYLENEEANAEAFDSDGWFRTGDVVGIDEDEYFYIVDRVKSLIKVKGYQVSPNELENILMGIPDIADVAVAGIPDDRSSEAPRAFVVLKEGSNMKEMDIIEYMNSRVAGYKRLSGGVRFIDAIPRNASGKILRKKLAEDYK